MSENEKKLELFNVTLDWPDGGDAGDYCSSFWAEDADAAVEACAEEMADNSDSGLDEESASYEDERAAYIEDLVSSAGPYAAVAVASSILPDIKRLLKGPEHKLSLQADEDLKVIREILARYGVAG